MRRTGSALVCWRLARQLITRLWKNWKSDIIITKLVISGVFFIKMDGNKDESERCIAIAKRFIDEGKRDVAVKYLQKAERLYPSQKAKELMELLNKLNGTTSMGGSSGPKTQTTENGDAAHHENRSSEANNSPESSESKHEYTKEQLEAVKRVKKCKDYYEILGVTKDATENDFKKQYKKMALQFHPDKNKAPGATEAFKAIGNAFAVLSDKEKRQRYDTYGANEEQHVTTRNRRGNTYYEYDYTRGCEADMTAEELFNMFFGRGFASEDVYVRRGNRWTRGEPRNSEHREQQNNYNAVLQMLPILILIVLSLTSSLFQSDPPYSLLESSKYPLSRQTQNLHVVYYVKENFLTENKNVRRIEQQVEEEYVSNLRASCFREMNYKETMVWRARQFRDDAQLKKANGMKTPSCEALMKMRS